MTLVGVRLKASMRFPPLRGLYQERGTCKGCDIICVKDDANSLKLQCLFYVRRVLDVRGELYKKVD